MLFLGSPAFVAEAFLLCLLPDSVGKMAGLAMGVGTGILFAFSQRDAIERWIGRFYVPRSACRPGGFGRLLLVGLGCMVLEVGLGSGAMAAMGLQAAAPAPRSAPSSRSRDWGSRDRGRRSPPGTPKRRCAAYSASVGKSIRPIRGAGSSGRGAPRLRPGAVRSGARDRRAESDRAPQVPKLPDFPHGHGVLSEAGWWGCGHGSCRVPGSRRTTAESRNRER